MNGSLIAYFWGIHFFLITWNNSEKKLIDYTSFDHRSNSLQHNNSLHDSQWFLYHKIFLKLHVVPLLVDQFSNTMDFPFRSLEVTVNQDLFATTSFRDLLGIDFLRCLVLASQLIQAPPPFSFIIVVKSLCYTTGTSSLQEIFSTTTISGTRDNFSQGNIEG